MKATDKKKNSIMVISTLKNNIQVPEHHIRKRAFEIFIERGEDEGSERNDWFQAEQELNKLKDN